MLNAKSQAQMDKILAAETTTVRMNYLKTALYPDEFGSRMPDELTQATNLYRSLREFTLVANMDGTVNAGKFSFAVKPIIGDTSSPSSFQVGIVDNSSGWPTEFTSSSAYVKDNLYSDPRVDPLINQLTGPPLGSYSQYTNFGASLPAIPNVIDGQCFTVDNVKSENLIVTQLPVLDAPITVGPFVGKSFQNCIGFSVPPGVYRFHPFVYVLGSLTNTNTPGLFLGFINSKTQELTGYIEIYPGSTVQYGIGQTNIDIVTEWSANVYSTSQSLFEDVLWDINVPTDTTDRKSVV